MAKLTIIGNPSPVVGKKEMYTISAINDYFQQIIPTQPLLNPQTPIHWGIFVQEKNTWRRTTDNKKGQAVPYTFGQKSLHFKAIKIVAQQGNESGELIIHPQQAKEPKITKVELLDANYLPLPKGKKISYQDTIIARAHCIEMYKRNVSFTLWEDDAKGEGHDPVTNMMNKINPVPIMGIVDEYGVAEAVFRLPFYTMAVQIANARIAAGETDEGPTHEYYVTAEYVAKSIMKASPNVNVINPTHIPPTPPSKTSSNTPETKPSKPKPKADTPKFPITSSGKKQADPDAKILNAEFLNERAQPIEKAEVGDTVIIKITTQHMKGRNVTVRIWEEETGYKTHDKIYEKKWVLPGNENFIKVPITKKIYELGITPEDFKNEKYDYKFQVYFIEVEPDNTHVTSQVIPISKTAPKLEVENSPSVAIIKKPKQQKEDSTCICQEQYKDLIWGAKVSCEFRKKVVQICAELWGESRKMDMANGLMAVMSVETNGSFKAHQLEGVNSLKSPQEMAIKDFWKKGNRKSSRAVGLIQFTQDALQNNLKEYSSNARLSVEEKFDELNNLKLQYAQMGEVNQLDKVKKYFEPQKEKIKSPEDIYLAVFAPKGIGKDDEYSLYTKHLVPKTKFEIEENKNYEANKSVDIENRGKKNGNDGVIQRVEILGRYRIKYTEGLQNKESHFNCGKIEMSKNKPTQHNNKWRHPLDLMELRGWYSIWAPERSIYGKNIVGRTKGKHDGLDLYAPVGTAIYACVDGKVADNYISVSYGNVLILRGKYNGETYYFFHAHMKEKSPLEKEADVSAGDIIGYTGKTGNASSLSSKQTHLHFEVKTKNTHAGNTVDPLSTISELKRDVNKNPNKETQK